MSSHFDYSTGMDPRGRVRDLRFTQAIPGSLGYHTGVEVRTDTPLRRRDSLTNASYFSEFRPHRGPNYPSMPGERSDVEVSADPNTAGPRVMYFSNQTSNAQHFRESFPGETEHTRAMRADSVHKIFMQMWRVWPSHSFEDRDVCRALALLWEANAATKGLEYPVFRGYKQDVTEKLVRLRRMSDICFIQDAKRAEEALCAYGFPSGVCDMDDKAMTVDNMDIDMPCCDGFDDDESLFGPGSPMQTDDDSSQIRLTRSRSVDGYMQ